MYQVANSQIVAEGGRALLRRRSSALVSRTVILLGLTSLFTDISSEMVTTILPLYLVYAVGLSPIQFGVIDGIQQGASALVRIGGGFFADRLRRYKEVAAVGYGVSAACRILFIAAGTAWGAIGAVMFADRLGKGIRTAPRDAMISLSSPPERLGAAFGVHRALDTAGATIGPLIAFGILVAAPHGYHSIFVVSFCFAIVGFAILVLFVQNPRERVEPAPREQITMRDVARLLAIPRFATLIAVGSVLALATMSDGFVYLGLQKNLGFAGTQLPLLYVATSLVYMVLAAPIGKLADRVGRGRVLVSGYALLLVVYAALIVPPPGIGGVALVVIAFGTYYAATDGVLMALVSPLLPPELRASGLALVVTATSLARLFASIVFGATWAFLGIGTAVVVFGFALVLATAAAAVVLERSHA